MQSLSVLESLSKNVLVDILMYTSGNSVEPLDKIKALLKLRLCSKKFNELICKDFSLLCEKLLGNGVVKGINWEQRVFSHLGIHSALVGTKNVNIKPLVIENRLIKAPSIEKQKFFSFEGAEVFHVKDNIECYYNNGMLSIQRPGEKTGKKELDRFEKIDFLKPENFTAGVVPENFKFSSVICTGALIAIHGYENGQLVLFLKKNDGKKFEKHALNPLDVEEEDKGYRSRIRFGEQRLLIREVCKEEHVWIAQVLEINDASKVKNEANEFEICDHSKGDGLANCLNVMKKNVLDHKFTGLIERNTKRSPICVHTISKTYDKEYMVEDKHDKNIKYKVSAKEHFVLFINSAGDWVTVKWGEQQSPLKANGKFVSEKPILNGFCDEFGTIHLLIGQKKMAGQEEKFSIVTINDGIEKSKDLTLKGPKNENEICGYQKPLLLEKSLDGGFVILDQSDNNLFKIVLNKNIISQGISFCVSGGQFPVGFKHTGNVIDVKANPSKYLSSSADGNYLFSDGRYVNKIIINPPPGGYNFDIEKTLSLQQRSQVDINTVENNVFSAARPQTLIEKIQHRFWKAIEGVQHLFVRLCQIVATLALVKVVGSVALTALLSAAPIMFCISIPLILFSAVVIL